MATTFSIILEMKVRFEIGLKLLRISGSSSNFFNRGFNRASFRSDGTVLSESDRFTIVVTIGVRTFKHFFSNHVGIGSSSHDVEEDLDRSFWIYSSEAKLKVDSVHPGST